MASDDWRNLKAVYKTRTGSIGAAFFQPCLTGCRHYRRAAGYFSSSALIAWAEALLKSDRFDIQIELLISPQLSEDDRRAFHQSTAIEACELILTRSSDSLMLEVLSAPNDHTRRTDFLIWLLATNKLQIQFALPRHIEGAGMFHQKSGVFTFPDGSRVGFDGSANETASGYERNYESVQVFRSWIAGDEERLVSVEQELEDQWTRQDEYLIVVPLSKNSLDLIQTRAKNIDDRVFRKGAPVPTSDPKWRHQVEAAEAFHTAKRGILEMATGTGKTKTALRIASELLKSKRIDSVIVTTEGRDLLQQWFEELLDWRLTVQTKMTLHRYFGNDHQGMAYTLSPENSALVISRGQAGKFLPLVSDRQAARTLIIHDEVHGLGAPFNRASLDGKHARFGYVLGLSATPEREYDQEGSDFIEREIGPTIYTFGLEDAIERGILVEFDYVPLPYQLTQGDRARLKAVYSRQAARAQAGQPMSKEEVWIELAKVYKTAELKPGIFADYLVENPSILKGCIIFVEEREYGERVLPMLHRENVRYRTYYADDDRENLLLFGRGEIDCVITCHKISQGIDIRSLRGVVLFASARARLETIQRVGRCLRSDPANPEKRAIVVDFVLQSEGDAKEPSADDLRREWLSDLSQVRRINLAN
jgi:superfamily II DNA or RNA helicase